MNDNNSTNGSQGADDKLMSFKSIDIESLKEANFKTTSKPLTAPSSSNSTIGAPSSPSIAPNTPNSSIVKEQQEYILSVKKIILNFLSEFPEGTLTFSEKDKKPKPLKRLFVLTRQKVTLQITENQTVVNHTYFINTGQYLNNNVEGDFYAAQDFVQKVLQPAFKWIADDKSIYSHKRPNQF